MKGQQNLTRRWITAFARWPALVGVALLATIAQAGEHDHANLGDVGRKLSDPTANIWALFTEFDLIFNNGEVNTGDAELGG